MSRIGKQPIPIPDSVKVSVKDGVVTVSSSDGKKKLEQATRLVEVKVEGNAVIVERVDDSRDARSSHGLYRTLIANMIDGVVKGWERKLSIEGAGYKVEQQGKKLMLTVGYTYPREYNVPDGVEVKVEGNNSLTVSGSNKQLVGQVAAQIRSVRPPDPYRGKGIRYSDEQAVRKTAKGKG